MKNQYVGDINDYVKYGLIHSIAKVFDEKILFVWMLTENDTSSHGSKIDYLKYPEKYQKDDGGLFDELNKIVDANNRNVAAIKNNRLFSHYEFISDFIKDDKESRSKYFDIVYEKAKNQNTIFFDPDNGIEVKDPKKGNKDSSKYVYWDEIQTVYDLKKNILVYQHFPQRPKGGREMYIENLVRECVSKFTEAMIVPIKTRNVVFIFILQKPTDLIYNLHDELKKWNGELEMMFFQKIKVIGTPKN